jgi:uncharacterized protein (DUF433 family)
MKRIHRIVSDPLICHGQPVIRGLRYPVEMILDLLASGMSHREVLDDYPDLEADDLLAALEYGAMASGIRRVVLLGAA